MPVIAVSGQPGCGSSTLASIIAKKLGLRHFSLGRIFKKLSKGRETERATKGFETKKGGSAAFHVKLDKMQRKIAEKGNVVIDSKLGIHMLGDIADFTIWIKAPEKIRAQRIMKRDNVSFKKAMKLLKERESAERNFFKKIYGFDPYKQEKKADLILNTTRKSPRQLAAITIKALKKDKII